ncbi:hypothetical protein [Aeoliella sp. SH292]|uniref:hypothetical protein n=1 Tax=Aeoliella sp. SH292 TaxID=3454464 RepID=UPI003F9A0465
MSSPDGPIYATREEAMAAPKQPITQLIPLDHPKNGQIVEVTSGSTTLDFDF